jgi:hypothetical protein
MPHYRYHQEGTTAMANIHTLLFAGACAVGLALAGAAAAQPAPGTVQGQLDNQQQRINQGVASGQLTPGEAARDESHEQSIQAQRNHDLAEHGGHLTADERAHLHARTEYNSHRIYDTKHNDKVAPR